MNELSHTLRPDGALGSAFNQIVETENRQQAHTNEQRSEEAHANALLRDIEIKLSPGSPVRADEALLLASKKIIALTRDAWKPAPAREIRQPRRHSSATAFASNHLQDVEFIERIKRRADDINRSRKDLSGLQNESASTLEKLSRLSDADQAEFTQGFTLNANDSESEVDEAHKAKHGRRHFIAPKMTPFADERTPFG